MRRNTKSKLDQIARRERFKQFGFLLLGAVISVTLILILALQLRTNPLGQTFISGEVVSIEDTSSGTGISFEVVVQFTGLQKVFQTDDVIIIDGLPDVVCILQTRGPFIGEDVPRARYHALADPSQCDSTK